MYSEVTNTKRRAVNKVSISQLLQKFTSYAALKYAVNDCGTERRNHENNFVLCSTIKHESCILTIQCAGL